MPNQPQYVRIICTNPEVAESLRQVALEVVPEKRKPLDQPVYDLAPAVYLHVPRLIFARPPESSRGDARADVELRALFVKALKEHGGQPLPREFPLFREAPLMPELRASIVAGLVLGVAFTEKVEVDDRYALLPWQAWHEARQLSELVRMGGLGFPTGFQLNLLQWRQTWEVPPELPLLEPSLEYTADLLCGLLPVGQRPTPWFVPEAGENPSVGLLRQKRVLQQQLDLGNVRSPGFYFQVQNKAMQVLPAKDAPSWAANLLPADGQTSWVSIWAYDGRDQPEQTVTATARLYGVAAADVQIVPLFMNRLGHWLGCAVRIGKGAVLVLPALSDKAESVRQLATGLWEPIQEWLRGNPAAPAKVAEEQTQVDPAGTPRSPAVTKQDGVDGMAEPKKGTPGLDRNSGAPLNEFKVVGEVWHVRFGDEYGEIVDRVGMARLCALLLQPNPAEAVTALRLCGVDEQGIEEGHASHQEVLDARARREYHDKLAELNTEIEEANNSENIPEAERLTRDREAILGELGRDTAKRRKGKELGPKDAKEKAAEAVSRSLKTTYATLREKGLPKAADHLEKAIKIESYAFAYRPGPQSPAWHF
jgi:hypothetical protein